jgi:hypothetical protein
MYQLEDAGLRNMEINFYAATIRLSLQVSHNPHIDAPFQTRSLHLSRPFPPASDLLRT